MLINYFIALCVFLVSFSVAREIPDYIHVCRRSDPHVAKCIRESIEFLRPRLKEGIPEIDVPSLEPLHINEITIFRGDPPSNLKAYLRNVNIHGASAFQITKIKLNVDKYTYRVGVKFPKLDFNGDYDVDAKVLSLPIKGNGKFKADITDVDGQGVLKGEVFEKNGHREIKFTSFDLAIKIGDYNLHLENLFDGDEVLTKALRDLLNENKGELIQGALPFIQSKTAEILLDAANKITEDVDYDRIFPE